MSAVWISSSLLRSRATHLRQLSMFSRRAVLQPVQVVSSLQKTWTPGNPTWCCRSLHVDSPPLVPGQSFSYVHGASSVSLLGQTVGQSLQAAADRWPHREALVFLQDGVRKTFSQFQEDVDQAAAGLLALGLKRGDRLGVWGPNTYHWILFQFATAKAGIILVSINPAYQLKELEFTLGKVQCKAVVCPTQFKTQRFCDMLRQICPEMDTAESGVFRSSRLPDLRMVIVTDSRQTGTVHVEDVMQAGSRQHHQELQDLQTKLSFDDPINIQFTSGTTGNPKGATLSHHNIVNNAYFVGLRLGFNWKPIRACVPVPLYHCMGSVLGAMCLALHGITLVFPSAGYDSRANLEAIQNERCNFLYGTPTMYIDMLGQPDLHNYDLSSVESGFMSGSLCPPEVMRKLKTDMNVNDMIIGYGTTENSPVTFLGFPRDNEELKTETVGCILNHTEAKVVDVSSGEVVPLGDPGELLIRAYSVMLEYWDDPDKTSEAIAKDRWYRTGDIASLDRFGYCRIVGRIKDMIIRGGENIYPAEIEKFLHTHPNVQEAQVIGVRDERLGEQVCACIRLKEGQDCSREEIRDFCKGQISHFKIPHYVVFVDSYPLTASGKIQKNKLREEMEKKLGL
ncbi:medium-chain acyl-CoA ligase ACSF2, mitochondrial-like isoform X1 [Oncorhynchus keta]|uniref:medium-chain acyl-CoA ligase ACSF2, mitochondrial-like isoform X1 n=1 Tax=Oncorhynchus keta TaxID=8018 RepID=UPI00227BA735|nr:medium-chain acyl-CoA ligase ACSF2, mitochondrial-like isoform X1 [Oncorhynchus keta]XP_052375954.1 medium-chain acyl-CoA ligase ACSF2, mitochondrial-like isoform X1 [Oncorhynchus keta]XP_052375955.1 medium-chain acyl-CoA ligase ACSF2, mitochondrial-like isoform X1 [Oncorhynchus keta]